MIAVDLNCLIKDAGQVVVERKIEVSDQQKLLFFEYKDFRFEVTNFNNTDFEIEVYDANVPARTYSKSRLINKGDYVSWSLWTRYASLDMECRK